MSTASSGYRWWEFYFVRYAVGTIVGGVVFFFICASSPPLDGLLLGATFEKIDIGLLPVFALYGLAYCYLASAPILVMHACRFGLSERLEVRYNTLLLFAIPGFGFLCLLHCLWQPLSTMLLLAALPAFLVWWMELVLLAKAFAGTTHMLAFYRQLSEKRSEAGSADLVESYRHLREHGNSFMIVVFEVILGILIFTFTRSDPAIGIYMQSAQVVSIFAVIMLLWIAPAASVWLLGTALERRFSGWHPANESSEPGP